jgi:hypothetical protein
VISLDKQETVKEILPRLKFKHITGIILEKGFLSYTENAAGLFNMSHNRHFHLYHSGRDPRLWGAS